MDCLVDDNYNVKASSRTSSTTNDKALSTLPVANQRKELSLPSDSLDESDAESVRSHDSDMFADVMAYVGALRTCESIFQEKIKKKRWVALLAGVQNYKAEPSYWEAE
jgi:hypothetical protein